MTKFMLPPVITEVVIASDRVRRHYAMPGLSFTLDGKLVGDIGEAVAAEFFGLTIRLGGGTGIDGHPPGGRSVQVKATGTGRGPVFREVDARADHLIFVEFNFGKRRARSSTTVQIMSRSRACRTLGSTNALSRLRRSDY